MVEYVIHVVVSEAEVEAIGRAQPSVPPDYWPGIALAKKGVLFKSRVGPLREDDMLPPWEVWRDPSTKYLHVRQGGQHGTDA